jgi:putative hydrolase of HD superfamily
MPQSLKAELDFLADTDRLKQVERMTSPIGVARKENSAEHSWQAVLAAIILEPYANQPVDLLKVLKMLAIHDVHEIETGDTFHYDKQAKPKLAEEEAEAAARIFGALPEPLRSELGELWTEFETRQTAEAKFANAVDRVMPMLLNSRNEGGTWRSHGITKEMLFARNSHAEEGCAPLWNAAVRMFEECMS